MPRAWWMLALTTPCSRRKVSNHFGAASGRHDAGDDAVVTAQRRQA
jgi:hypothetical protein